jgi:hypothetical protein
MIYARRELSKFIMVNEAKAACSSKHEGKTLNDGNGNDRKYGSNFNNMSDLQEAQTC